jgi:hypothetical protein
MMRDRIVQSEMQPPTPPTVAEEVFQPTNQQMGLGAIAPQGMEQGMGQGMDQGMEQGMGMGQPSMPPQMMAEGGLARIPVRENMFDYAGGGIIAFQAGGGTFNSFMGEGMREDRPTMRGIVPTFTGALEGVGDYFRGGIYKDIEKLKQLGYTDAQISAMSPEQRSEVARMSRESIREAEKQSPTESLIAQAQRGEGPNVSRPAAPADMAKVPSGGPVIPRPTGLQREQPPPPPGPKPEPGPTSAVPGLREQLMGRINEAYPDQAGGAKPTEPSVKGLFQERAEAERIAGVDKDFFKNEARNIVKQRDELKGDKKEAANMRLIEAGLRIMGGESPYAFVNIGKGASEALKGFADDVKDIQKTKREYDKAERDLRIAEQTYARSKSDEALKEVQRRRERAEERNTSFQKAMMGVEVQLAELALREKGVKAQTDAAARPGEMERMIRLATDPNATEDQKKLARGVIEQRGGASQQATLQLRALNELLTSKQNQLFTTKDRQAKQKIQEEINIIQGQIRSIGGLGGGAGSADPDLLRRADAILGIR